MANDVREMKIFVYFVVSIIHRFDTAQFLRLQDLEV